MKTNEIRISVIIPVYNVELYIEDCLRSVTGQSVSDIEIICVDDESTDGSMDIVEALRKEDPRISAIYSKHAGLGATRNTGVGKAKGKYILFLDSDDMFAEGSFEKLLAAADSMNTDILYFGCDSLYDPPGLENEFPKYRDMYKRKIGDTDVMKGLDLFTKMHRAQDFKHSSVLQIYRRNFISSNGLRFYEGILHEDALYSSLCIMRAERAAVMDEPFYIRRVRDDSIMTSSYSFDNVYGYYIAMKELMKAVGEYYPSCVDDETSRTLVNAVKKLNRLAARMYDNVGAESVEQGLAGIAPYDRILFELTVKPESRNNRLKERNIELKSKNDEKNERIRELSLQKSELKRLKKSRSYKIGRAITFIPRKLKRH